jgi:hypothetical protein
MSVICLKRTNDEDGVGGSCRISCRLADFCISGVEASSCTTRELDNWSDES